MLKLLTYDVSLIHAVNIFSRFEDLDDDDSDDEDQWKQESESSSDEERSTSASVERSPCAVNMTVSPTSLLSDEHSNNDVSSTTDCATITIVRIDSTSSSKSKKWDKKHACNFFTKLVIKMSDRLKRLRLLMCLQ